MAKGKRRLKKTVNYVLGDLFTATLALDLSGNVDKDNIAAIQSKILDVYNDYISRLSHIEPGSSKLFFKNYIDGLNKEIVDIADDISKASQKSA